MSWPIPTSGEAMVSLKGRVGSSRARRGRVKRAAFRKFRGRTYWVAYNDDTVLSAPLGLSAGSQDPVRWISIGTDTGLMGTTTQGYYIPALNTRHLLRFDGHIHVGMQMQDDRDVDSNGCHPNETWLWYWWLKEKTSPGAGVGGTGFPGGDVLGSSAAHDLQDTEEPDVGMDLRYTEQFMKIMSRRDVIKWGIVKVIGPALRGMDTVTPAPLLDGHQGYREGTTLPFPKVPAGGFKLTPDERLACWVVVSPPFQRPVLGTALGYSATTSPRPVVGMPAFRMLIG